MAVDENTGDDANGHVGDGDPCDNVHPSPCLDAVKVEPPTECGDGSESNSTPCLPYMPVTTIPWINKGKGMNVKNITRDLADMGYRLFKIS